MRNIRFYFFVIVLAVIFIANFSAKKISISNKNTNLADSIVQKKIELGRMLFYDPVLSGDNTISCASCHKQQFAFADTAKFSKGVNGKLTRRNTMSLVNLKWSEHFFWDGRANSLEEQILFPIQDSLEMGQNLTELEKELNANVKYKKLFSEIFKIDKIEISQITNAIAGFVRNLYSRNSPMDFVFSPSFTTEKNDDLTMSDLFKKGIEQFSIQNNISIDKNMVEMIAKKSLRSDNAINAFVLCIQCHDKNFFQPDALIKNNGLPVEKDDFGLGNISGKKEDAGLFKVPTFRNVALTAPYMHDGRFKTLKDVVQYYNSGIQHDENLDVLLIKNGKPLRLNLTKEEVNEMVVFLELLTDSICLNNPAYSNPLQ